MAKMTMGGVITSKINGTESYESYRCGVSRRNLVQYDYRHTDGELFSCVSDTLDKCREKKDIWLETKHVNMVTFANSLFGPVGGGVS